MLVSWLPHSICGFHKDLLLLFPFSSPFHFLRFQSPAFCLVISLDFKKPSWGVGGDNWPVGADPAQVRRPRVTPGLMTLTRGWLLSGSLRGSHLLCTEGRGETCLPQVLSSAGAEAQLCPRVGGPTPPLHLEALPQPAAPPPHTGKAVGRSSLPFTARHGEQEGEEVVACWVVPSWVLPLVRRGSGPRWKRTWGCFLRNSYWLF